MQDVYEPHVQELRARDELADLASREAREIRQAAELLFEQAVDEIQRRENSDRHHAYYLAMNDPRAFFFYQASQEKQQEEREIRRVVGR